MNTVETQGRKEVTEAVIQATIIALATALINWGVELAKSKAAAKSEKKDEANG